MTFPVYALRNTKRLVIYQTQHW